MTRLSLIGFGEAGTAFAEGFLSARPAITAHDLAFSEDSGMVARAERLGVTAADSMAAALSEADIILSVVTADQAVAAASLAADHINQGALYCDMNSCAPASKVAAAAAIEAAGGRYVDVAVMAPVYPKRNLVPLLVAGPHAAEAAARLKTLPMAPTVVEGPVGAASSIKMIRSVMVKGLEALTAECLLAATKAGVADAVLGSLTKSHGGTDWPRQTAYNFERMLAHGARRAAEMDEVAKTLADLGLPNAMARATADWQRAIVATGETADPDEPVTNIANRILKSTKI